MKWWYRLPRIVRFMGYHSLWGIVIGAIVTLVMIHFDLGGVGKLVADSPLATTILFFQMCLTFGAVAQGIAIMSLETDDDDD